MSGNTQGKEAVLDTHSKKKGTVALYGAWIGALLSIRAGMQQHAQRFLVEGIREPRELHLQPFHQA